MMKVVVPTICPVLAMVNRASITITLTALPILGYAENNDLFQLSLLELSNIIVTTASHRDEPINDAPGVVKVINRQHIEQLGVRNLRELLDHVPGINVLYDTRFGFRSVSIRGDDINGNRVLFLINGVPYRSYSTGVIATRALLSSFPIQTLERLEVIKGPGSVLYGSNAFTGVINLITRQATDPTANVGVQLGSYNEHRLQVNAGGQWHDFQLDASADIHQHDGAHQGYLFDYNLLPTVEQIQLLEFDQQHQHDSLFLSAEYHKVRLSLQHLSQEDIVARESNNFSGPTTTLEHTSRQTHIALQHQHNFSEAWNYTSQLAWLHIQDQVANENNYTAEVTFAYQNQQFKALIGSAINDAFAKQNASSDLPFNDDGITNYSVFSQLQYQWFESLTSIVGLQHNQVKEGEQKLVPRLALIWDITPQQGIKLLYNEAFRSPSIGETDTQITTFVGNPDLRPETVQTTDLQWFHTTSQARYSITYYYTEQKDLISIDASSTPATFRNNQSANYQGLEFEGEYQINNRWHMEFGYNYQTNKNSDNDHDFSLLPTHQILLGVSAQVSPLLRCSIHDQYSSAFFSNGITPYNPNSRPSHNISVNIRLDLSKYLSNKTRRFYSIFQIRNLLNDKIYAPNFVTPTTNTLPVDIGRWANLGVYYGF